MTASVIVRVCESSVRLGVRMGVRAGECAVTRERVHDGERYSMSSLYACVFVFVRVRRSPCASVRPLDVCFDV